MPTNVKSLPALDYREK